METVSTHITSASVILGYRFFVITYVLIFYKKNVRSRNIFCVPGDFTNIFETM